MKVEVILLEYLRHMIMVNELLEGCIWPISGCRVYSLISRLIDAQNKGTIKGRISHSQLLRMLQNTIKTWEPKPLLASLFEDQTLQLEEVKPQGVGRKANMVSVEDINILFIEGTT